MRKLNTFLSFLFLITSLMATYGQVKIAHINTQELISEMPELIAANKQLEKLQKTYATELENTYKELRSKAESYAADASNQTDVTNQARQKELESMQENISDFRETAAQDLQKKQSDLMNPIIEKAKQAIIKVAKAQGFTYVLDSSPGGSVIMAEGKNLATDVKKELGI